MLGYMVMDMVRVHGTIPLHTLIRIRCKKKGIIMRQIKKKKKDKSGLLVAAAATPLGCQARWQLASFRLHHPLLGETKILTIGG